MQRVAKKVGIDSATVGELQSKDLYDISGWRMNSGWEGRRCGLIRYRTKLDISFLWRGIETRRELSETTVASHVMVICNIPECVSLLSIHNKWMIGRVRET